MGEIYWPGICGTYEDWAFWSTNITWNTDKPRFTLCFQNTILSWIPVGVFSIFAPCYLYYLLQRPMSRRKGVGCLPVMKVLLCLGIICAAIYNIVRTSKDHTYEETPHALYLQPAIDILMMIVMIIVTVLERKKDVYSSALVYGFWSLTMICDFFVVVSKAMDEAPNSSERFHIVTASVTFALSTLQWFVHCFADSGETRSYNIEDDEQEPLLRLRAPETGAEQRNPCPEMKASALSRLCFSWITGLVFRGYRRPLTENDLWDLSYENSSVGIVPRVEKDWLRASEKVQHEREREEEQARANIYTQTASSSEEAPQVEAVQPERKTRVSLLAVLCRNFSSYALAGLYKITGDTILFLQPQLLSLLIAFISSGSSAHVWHGYMVAVGLYVVAMVKTFITQQYYNGCYVTGMRLRTAVIGMVYRKALRLSSSARKDVTVGEIVNLMSVDAQRLQDVPTFLHVVWTAPIQMIVAIVFLWNVLGASVLAGVAVLLLLLPINSFLSFKMRSYQMCQMKLKDNRIKVMNEVLNGIKVLKLYAWELSFAEKITAIREQEVRILRKSAYLSCVGAICWFCAPLLVSLTTFGVYVLSSPDHVLTAQKAFVSLSLFNILQFPLSMLPGTINMLVQTLVSIRRINLFLESDELDPDAVEHLPASGYGPSSEPAVTIRNGNFCWGHCEESILNDINLEAPTGKLIAVVGEVGSGKTSLISAILGEMFKKDGEVRVKGTVAYVPQQAWCQNASLRENILFGKRMSRSKYNEVLEACALKADLEVLPGGDQIEIGEKGINLSGGQKQRVSLARATYADADIYLLDDPLSAVDAHVGKHIFDKVLARNTGMLASKTRILVTHALSFLPHCDTVVVMRDGCIDVMGSYSELLVEDGPFAQFLREYLSEEMENEEDEAEDAGDENDMEASERSFKRQLFRQVSRLSVSESEDSKPIRRQSSLRRQSSTARSRRESTVSSDQDKLEAEENEAHSRLIEAETSETGSVKWSVFVAYLSAVTWTIFVPMLLVYATYIGVQVGNNIWLSKWSTANTTLPDGSQDTAQRDLYLGVYGGIGAVQALVVVAQNFLMAIGTFRASRDLHFYLLNNILRAPMAFFDTTPLGRILNRFSKDIDTVDINIPLTFRIWLSTFASVLSTLIIVSYASPVFLIALIPLSFAYYFVQRFYVCSSRQMKRIDSVKRSPIYSHFQESVIGATSIRSYFRQHEFIAKSDQLVDDNQKIWYPNIISYRWLGSFLETVGNIIILLAAIFAVVYRDQMGPGVAGLSVTYALQVTNALSFMVRMSTDMETYIVAVERLKEYSEIENEAPLVADFRPAMEWPETGVVSFRNYSVRYRADLDLVLRGITADVRDGERIGIVGRTGAGKSSLTLALFRILEPAGGTIMIDGIDITRLGLHDLRSKITIIPQDPVLFSGTLRANLDPANVFPDSRLWTALEQAGLHRFVSGQPEGLEFVCAEGGENLSVGQRQLVCLARALLRRTRVLVLDEATAAVDVATDDFIQSTIRSQFGGCTVLTIAHRLNTIMDYDRIMVLDKGEVKEMDTPGNLLANRDSIFFSMAHEANLA